MFVVSYVSYVSYELYRFEARAGSANLSFRVIDYKQKQTAV